MPHKINTLADGSPTRFLRILSYGLANLRIRRRTSFHARGVSFIPQKGSMNPVDHKGASVAVFGPQNEPAARDGSRGVR